MDDEFQMFADLFVSFLDLLTSIEVIFSRVSMHNMSF